MSGQVYISVAKVAEIVGVDKSTIWRWKRAKKFPAPTIQTGGSTRWSEKVVRDWCSGKAESEGA
ncbi:helix-turn-helix transcriptional regulator [Bombella saccharophila]|uniref:helix-turn-helix transcriptional regulator n=1 Tax=Bombella saccharophila TaxID=2967338 RepID=UPI0038990374